LFTQPEESHLGECPICFLPMPLDPDKHVIHSCCSKKICNGCVHFNFLHTGGKTCPLCRASYLDETYDKQEMKRAEANDPEAISNIAWELYKEGDLDGAFQHFAKAAELGDSYSHYQIGVMYRQGISVKNDNKKAVYHWEKAAIGGHPEARHNLGSYEQKNGNTERSVKHFIIAANLGYELSMQMLWKHYSLGNITKEDLDSTLRTHQAAIDEMKSGQRDLAERARQGGELEPQEKALMAERLMRESRGI